jgi:hypothetical protein
VTDLSLEPNKNNNNYSNYINNNNKINSGRTFAGASNGVANVPSTGAESAPPAFLSGGGTVQSGWGCRPGSPDAGCWQESSRAGTQGRPGSPDAGGWRESSRAGTQGRPGSPDAGCWRESSRAGTQGWVSRTFRRSRSAYRPKSNMVQVHAKLI